MELRQLRYVVALADERQFTRAAARLNIAQPALSQQIRKLEQELGLPIVDRTPWGAELTPEGERVVARAHAILAEVEALRDEAGELTGLRAGRVAVGVTPTPGPLDVSGLLAGFHREHPHVELAVSEQLSVTMLEQVGARALDVAFVTTVAGHDRLGLDVRRIAQERLVAIVPPGHVLAGRRTVRIASLKDERFVAFPRGATIRAAVERVAADRGFVPAIAFETSDTARMRALVAEGLGVAVLPASDAAAPGRPVAVVGLRDAGLVHEVFLAQRADRRLPPAVRAFIAHVSPGSPPRAPARRSPVRSAAGSTRP